MHDLGDLTLGNAVRLVRGASSSVLGAVVGKVVDAVDVDAVVRRVDVDDVAERIDVDKVVKRIDVDDVVERIDVEAVTRRAAGSVPKHGLDAVRGTLTRLDRLAERLKPGTERPEAALPGTDGAGGPLLYAGPITRLTAYAIDTAIVSAGYGVVLGAIAMLWGALTKEELGLPAEDSLIWLIGLGLWALAYYAGSWSLGGQTPGQALFAIGVIRRDGSELGGRRAIGRTLGYLSIPLLVPLIGVVAGRERRAFHDVIAGSIVIRI